jgi:hypothetical protein
MRFQQREFAGDGRLAYVINVSSDCSQPPYLNHPREFKTNNIDPDEAPGANHTNSGDIESDHHPGLTTVAEVV